MQMTIHVSENRTCKVIERLDISNNFKICIIGVTVASNLGLKLLGLIVENQLTFKSLKIHASQKLNAHTRITSYMDQHKRRITMKGYINSQSGYCPLEWMMLSKAIQKKK